MKVYGQGSQTGRKNSLFLILFVLSVLSHFIFPIKTIITPPIAYFGLLPVAFGLLMDMWVSTIFYNRKTPISPYGKPTSLVVKGPFRVSRNPIYLGMFVLLLGVAIFLGSLVTFIFPIIFLVIVETRFIPREEKSLEKAFGNEYDNYKRRVRRWI